MKDFDENDEGVDFPPPSRSDRPFIAPQDAFYLANGELLVTENANIEDIQETANAAISKVVGRTIDIWGPNGIGRLFTRMYGGHEHAWGLELNTSDCLLDEDELQATENFFAKTNIKAIC